MMTVRGNTQLKMYALTIEDMVPKEHFLRKLDAAIDFSFIYDEVKGLYSGVGRPSIDPVILIKTLLLGFIYGIQSERRIALEIQVNIAYRWFLGLDLDESVPDHSTMSQNRRRRFNGTDLFRKIFERVLAECIAKGLVDGKLIVTDSTHVKANASAKSAVTVEVEKEAAAYMEQLDKYEAEERAKLEAEGKIKPKKKRCANKKQADVTAADDTIADKQMVEKTLYATDPDAGNLCRPGKPQGAHYLDHQSIDAKNGIIVDVTVTAGNANDADPYAAQLSRIEESTGLKIESVAVDSAYDIAVMHQILEERGITIFTPERAKPKNGKVEFTRNSFVYDSDSDVFICPNNRKLTLRRLQRGASTVSREYQCNAADCKDCPYKAKCLAPSQKARKLQVNILEDVYRKHHENDGSPKYKAAIRLRQIWCEGTFAAQKRIHNLKQTLRVGLEAAYDHCLLSATAINLKRLIKAAA